MTTDDESRDRAGRALYEQGQTMLPRLGQPPAPGWEELDEPVRERWRRNAAGPAVPRAEPDAAPDPAPARGTTISDPWPAHSRASDSD